MRYILNFKSQDDSNGGGDGSSGAKDGEGGGDEDGIGSLPSSEILRTMLRFMHSSMMDKTKNVLDGFAGTDEAGALHSSGQDFDFELNSNNKQLDSFSNSASIKSNTWLSKLVTEKRAKKRPPRGAYGKAKAAIPAIAPFRTRRSGNDFAVHSGLQ